MVQNFLLTVLQFSRVIFKDHCEDVSFSFEIQWIFLFYYMRYILSKARIDFSYLHFFYNSLMRLDVSDIDRRVFII